MTDGAAPGPSVQSLEEKLDAGWAELPDEMAPTGPSTPAEPASPAEGEREEPATRTAEPGQDGRAEPSTPAASPEGTRQSNYDYWLTRYKREGMSDEDAREAAAREALNLSNSLADTNRRLSERERELEELRRSREAEVPAAAAPEVPEELAQITKRLDAFQATFQQCDQKVKDLRTKAEAKVSEIKKLERSKQRPGADIEQVDFDVDTLKEELAELNQEMRETAARGNAAVDQHDALVPFHQQAVKVHELSRALRTRDEADASADQVRQDAQERSSFYDIAKAIANDAAIGMPEKLREKFCRPRTKDDLGGFAIRSALAVLVPDPTTGKVPSLEFRSFLTKLAKDYVADIKESHESLSAVYAGQKLRDAGQAGQGATGATATEERRKPSVEDLEERIAAAEW